MIFMDSSSSCGNYNNSCDHSCDHSCNNNMNSNCNIINVSDIDDIINVDDNDGRISTNIPIMVSSEDDHSDIYNKTNSCIIDHMNDESFSVDYELDTSDDLYGANKELDISDSISCRPTIKQPLRLSGTTISVPTTKNRLYDKKLKRRINSGNYQSKTSNRQHQKISSINNVNISTNRTLSSTISESTSAFDGGESTSVFDGGESSNVFDGGESTIAYINNESTSISINDDSDVHQIRQSDEAEPFDEPTHINVVDHTRRKQQLCRDFVNKNKCRKGDHCRFLHPKHITESIRMSASRELGSCYCGAPQRKIMNNTKYAEEANIPLFFAVCSRTGRSMNRCM